MKKKNLLVLTPVTPHHSSSDALISSLSFLESEYNIHPMDSLSIMDDLPNETYYRLWEEKIAACLSDYDAFFGFSFGGVILQQCFSLFLENTKPIVLFSTPTRADASLKMKLELVITLCKEGHVEEALHYLDQQVYYPNEIPQQIHQISDNNHAAQRMIFGLHRVLSTDTTTQVTECNIKHLHLIGERSHLVNKDSVIAPKTGALITVPDAGMRILKDNPAYCRALILGALNNEL